MLQTTITDFVRLDQMMISCIFACVFEMDRQGNVKKHWIVYDYHSDVVAYEDAQKILTIKSEIVFQGIDIVKVLAKKIRNAEHLMQWSLSILKNSKLKFQTGRKRQTTWTILWKSGRDITTHWRVLCSWLIKYVAEFIFNKIKEKTLSI